MKEMTKENLGCIVVCYNTDGDYIKRFENLLKLSNHVIIVINRFSEAENQLKFINELHNFFFDMFSQSNMQILELEENYGIGTALNMGVGRLANLCEWLVFFDDDTLLLENSISDISVELKTVLKRVGVNNFGILGLGYTHDIDARYISQETEIQEKHMVITSGSLLNINTFYAVGKFCEDYFIDSIDVE